MTEFRVEHYRDGALYDDFRLDGRLTHWDMYLQRCEGNNDSFILSGGNSVSIMDFSFDEDLVRCYIENNWGGGKFVMAFLHDGDGPYLLRDTPVHVTGQKVYMRHNYTKTITVDGDIISDPVDDFQALFLVKSEEKYYLAHRHELPEDVLEQLRTK